jgi:hypothetical protein
MAHSGIRRTKFRFQAQEPVNRIIVVEQALCQTGGVKRNSRKLKTRKAFAIRSRWCATALSPDHPPK